MNKMGEREITNEHLNAAYSAHGMVSMTRQELEQLAKKHEAMPLFANKVTAQAARLAIAEELRREAKEAKQNNRFRKTEKWFIRFINWWVRAVIALHVVSALAVVFLLKPTIWDGLSWLLWTYNPFNLVTYFGIGLQVAPAFLVWVWYQIRRTQYRQRALRRIDLDAYFKGRH